ncbi:MAG TPA: NAD(P)/FAD-dependent oxidoreductase [Terriglobia bacterium]|nr:NAD(P)/FAD-dependent oxidoreductase [Terriglobia bacterium]
MPNSRDVVIVGAGHNALVAAFYVARAGLHPLVLERRPVAGGAAATEEFHPGFRSSIYAHAAAPLAPRVVQDMGLARHSLETIRPDPAVFAPAADGRALVLYRDSSSDGRSAQSIARFSKRDAGKYPEFAQTLARLAGVLQPLMLKTPPALGAPRPGDLWTLLGAGRALRGLGSRDMFRLLRWGPMAVADLAAEWFESEPLRAVLAGRGIFGAALGPWSAGSGALMLLRAAFDPEPASGVCFVRGGMGKLAGALAEAAAQAGAEIRTGAEVAAINVRNGEATGVTLTNGEEITAKAVVSGADPRRTFLGLIDPTELEPDFVGRVRNYRSSGVLAKVNLALAGLPSFAAAGNSAEGHAALAGRIHIGPEIDYLERAFDASKYGAFSAEPYLDAALPSLSDPELAPAGRHVMSIYAQFAPDKLRGAHWNAQREALGDAVVAALARHAPDLPGLILHRQVLTPLDLEVQLGLSGGHIFHGELALDQLFSLRPLLGWAGYRTPVRHLYLCGSGTHPGVGLSGASGSNAAREFLKDWKKRARGD